MPFGFHLSLIIGMVGIMDIGEGICIGLMTILDRKMILETLLVPVIKGVFGSWSMLLAIIWVISTKTMDKTILSTRGNIIMISVPFPIVISPLKIRIELRTAD
jgi:hypothetical protein